MQHCSPEQLALAALREPLPAEDADHLAGCEECRREVASLQRSVDVLAVPEFAAPGAAVPPPPHLWAGIAAATGVSAALHDEPPLAPVVQLRRPARRWLGLAAAVVAGVAVGAGAVAVTRDDGPSGTVVATAGLDALAGENASGRAEVREEDGHRLLEVDLSAPSLEDGYYEVWLLQPDAQRMVQVGAVTAGDTVLPLPPGVDLAAYPVVDVSVEPLDGDPTHSGKSVARGSLSR